MRSSRSAFHEESPLKGRSADRGSGDLCQLATELFHVSDNGLGRSPADEDFVAVAAIER